jgi:aryl-alcohol dehydrogenase-like predicted oxidoreductase
MRYNILCSTGLFVSELSFGTMTFGGAGAFGSIGKVQQVLELG